MAWHGVAHSQEAANEHKKAQKKYDLTQQRGPQTAAVGSAPRQAATKGKASPPAPAPARAPTAAARPTRTRKRKSSVNETHVARPSPADRFHDSAAEQPAMTRDKGGSRRHTGRHSMCSETAATRMPPLVSTNPKRRTKKNHGPPGGGGQAGARLPSPGGKANSS